MRYPLRTVLLSSLATTLTAPFATAQNRPLPFDAPEVVFDSRTAITSVGDFDADGAVDYVGWYWNFDGYHQNATLRVFRGNGQGGTSQQLSWDLFSNSGADTAWDTHVGDLDGQPGDDLVVAFEFDVDVRIARPLGQGINLQPFARLRESFPVHAVRIVDVDRDGRNDVAVLGQELRVYRNTGLGIAHLASFPVHGTELFAGDTDGDGFDELVVPVPGAVEVFRYGQAALARVLRLQHGVMPTEVPMTTCGDVDGDGDDDLVVFAEAGDYVTMRCIGADDFRIEARRVGGPATGLADIDGDGDLDGVCCGGGGAPPAVNDRATVFHLSRNDGTGRFEPAQTIDSLGAFRLAGVVDVDRDGDPDLVAGRVILHNRGHLLDQLTPDVDTALAALPRGPLLDVDEDGDPDLIGRRAHRLVNDGSGDFPAIHAPHVPAGLAASLDGTGYHGDFDGDGDLDVVMTRFDAQGRGVAMHLLRNTGGGDYVDGGEASPTPFLPSALRSQADDRHRVADFDGDGDLDVAQGRYAAGAAVTLFLNDGLGRFVAGPSNPTLLGVPMATADFDGDGASDVVTHLGVWLNDGSGVFTLAHAIPPGSIRPELDVIATGDLDGNGLADVGYLNGIQWNGTLKLLRNLGNGGFEELNLSSVAPDRSLPFGVVFADLDRDGHLDVLHWPASSRDGAKSVAIAYNNGVGRIAATAVQIMDVSHPLADLDGDGVLDAVGHKRIRGLDPRGPTSGTRRQFGTAFADPAGFTPVLGASGDLRGGGNLQLRLRGLPGGSIAFLGLGTVATPLANWPVPGATLHLVPDLVATLGVVSGIASEAGTGSFDLHLALPASVSGTRVYHQAWALTPDARTLVHTGCLELGYR